MYTFCVKLDSSIKITCLQLLSLFVASSLKFEIARKKHVCGVFKERPDKAESNNLIIYNINGD